MSDAAVSPLLDKGETYTAAQADMALRLASDPNAVPIDALHSCVMARVLVATAEALIVQYGKPIPEVIADVLARGIRAGVLMAVLDAADDEQVKQVMPAIASEPAPAVVQ